MSPGRALAGRQGGFTLMEVLVALGILAVGVTGVMALFLAGSGSSKRSFDKSGAALAARSVEARVQAELRAGTDPAILAIPPNLSQPLEQWAAPVDGFAGFWHTVEFLADPSGVVQDEALLVRITIWWKSGGRVEEQAFVGTLHRRSTLMDAEVLSAT